MKESIDKMGVYVLVSHLIITLAIIGVYCYTLFSGQGDETLKTILTVIVGYWFGSMGVNVIKPPDQTNGIVKGKQHEIQPPTKHNEGEDNNGQN